MKSFSNETQFFFLQKVLVLSFMNEVYNRGFAPEFSVSVLK